MQKVNYKNVKYFLKTEMKKNANLQRISIIITNTLNVILYGLFFMYTLSDDYYNLKNVMNRIVLIENKAPLLSIIEKSECDKQANEYEELIYKWPGTKEGCICQREPLQKNNHGVIEETLSQAYSKGKFILRKVCQRKGVRCLNKVMIKSHKMEKLFHWNKQKKLCIQLVDPKMLIKPQDCYKNSGYKLCNSNICIRNDLDCPITGINFENDTLNIDREGASPIVELRASQNEPPCIFHDYKPHRKNDGMLKHYNDYPYITTKVQDYFLLTKIKNLGCKHQILQKDYKLEYKTSYISKLKEKQFYVNNEMWDMFEKEIQLYTVFLELKDEMKLYGVQKFGFDTKRCNGISLWDLKRELDLYDNFFYQLDFFIVFLSLLWIIDIFAFIFGNSIENLCLNKAFQTTVIVCSYIFIGSCTIHGYFINTSRQPNLRNFVKNTNCFLFSSIEDALKVQMKKEIKNSDNLAIMKILTLVMFIIQTIVNLLYLLLLYRKKRIEKIQVGEGKKLL